jgi:penicillin-binding protein 1A
LRQPGSAFKPIVYAAALSHGMTPASIVMDSPVVYENFRPENYGRKFLGSLTLTEALARSVNNAAVHVLEEIGIQSAIEPPATDPLGWSQTCVRADASCEPID